MMIIPTTDANCQKRLKLSFLLTGLLFGPLYTVAYAFFCLDYIFGLNFEIFNFLMGLTKDSLLHKVAFVEYSIALSVNIVYLVLLFILLKR